MSIKVVIAGRSYPLMVQEHEEEKILKATQDINRAIEVLQENYAVRDMQDLLAMTALQLSVQVQDNRYNSNDYREIEQALEALSKEIEPPILPQESESIS